MSIFRTIAPWVRSEVAPAAGGAGAEIPPIDLLVSAIFKKNLDEITEILPGIAPEALETQVSVGESVNAKPIREIKLTPLGIAAHLHFVEAVFLLVEAGAPRFFDEGNLYTSKPRHLFDFAIFLGELPLMRDLIKRDKKELQAFSDNRIVFLMWNGLNQFGFEVLDLCLSELGWDINTVDGMGATLLNYAARSGQQKVVEGLIKRGACVEFEKEEELFSTPLMETARPIHDLMNRDLETAEEKYRNRMACFAALIKAGANPERVGFDLLKGFFECPMDDEDEGFLALMEESGVCFDCTDEKGATLLTTVMNSLVQVDNLEASEDRVSWVGGFNSKRIELLARSGVMLPEDLDEFVVNAMRELCFNTDLSDEGRTEIADLLDKSLKEIIKIFHRVDLERKGATFAVKA